jgi:hypothetical protein
MFFLRHNYCFLQKSTISSTFSHIFPIKCSIFLFHLHFFDAFRIGIGIGFHVGGLVLFTGCNLGNGAPGLGTATNPTFGLGIFFPPHFFFFGYNILRLSITFPAPDIKLGIPAKLEPMVNALVAIVFPVAVSTLDAILPATP